MQAAGRLGTGVRYTVNLVDVVSRQRGYLVAGTVAARFLASEAAKMPAMVRRALHADEKAASDSVHPTADPAAIVAALKAIPVPVEPYRVDVEAFRLHLATNAYPRYYAGGPIERGGWREEKALEYVVSLDLLDIQPDDVVIDVASEWSIFPDIVRRGIGARVYRQDMIYPPGIDDDRIGGNAANMPVPDAFADKLILHNAFEHFEGTADSDFIVEAWRVLKPGGSLCILPLFVADRYSILTDPLVGRDGIVWDDGANVVELPWWHNRFGRFYDVAALQRRVLQPGRPFSTTIYHVENPEAIHPLAYLRFALVMQKPLT